MEEMTDQNLPMEAGAPNQEIELWDSENPRALINIVHPRMSGAMRDLYARRPDLLGMDERDLYKRLRSEETCPNPTDNRLRLKFWVEYDRAQHELSKMNMSSIYGGVTTQNYFTERYLSRPEKVAWMLCPPADYSIKMEEALAFGIEQLRDILELPNQLPSGKTDVKLLELKAKIVAMMDLRVKGAVITKNVQLNLSQTGVDKKMVEGSMEEIEKRIKDLEKQDRNAAKFAQAISVETEE